MFWSLRLRRLLSSKPSIIFFLALKTFLSYFLKLFILISSCNTSNSYTNYFSSFSCYSVKNKIFFCAVSVFICDILQLSYIELYYFCFSARLVSSLPIKCFAIPLSRRSKFIRDLSFKLSDRVLSTSVSETWI